MKVLHIEDLDSIFSCIKASCPNISFDQAETIREARAMLDSGGYDAILLDLELPDSSGLNSIESVLEYDIPIVVLTGDPTDASMKEAMDLGVLDYIRKTNISKSGICQKLESAHQKHKRIKKNGGKRFAFSNLDSIKPYLTCASFNGGRPPFSAA
jgi:DNA-binding NtrC family response regulator